MRRHPFPPETKDATPPFEVIEGGAFRRLVLTCDHASNHVPAPYGDLGLGPAAFERHIAYDIGMRGVTLKMAERLGATAILSTFSRLLIDPNRGEDDPTIVMRLSDGDLIPGNARVDRAEIDSRVAQFHRPYHAAIADKLDALTAEGEIPMLISMHSFTPRWKQFVRPWHIGLLWDLDDRVAKPLLEALRGEGDIEVGDNEPYDGALIGDGMNRHGTGRGLPHVLVEIRQDLVADEAGQAAWADRLARLVPPLMERPEMNRVAQYGSRAEARRR